jgi:hypothetical protein
MLTIAHQIVGGEGRELHLERFAQDSTGAVGLQISLIGQAPTLLAVVGIAAAWRLHHCPAGGRR